MHPTVVEVFKTLRAAHESMVKEESRLRETIQKCTSKEDQADFVYGLRECAEFADDTRKRCNKLKELAEHMACMLSVALGDGGPIRTEYCTGTPRVRTLVSIPRRSTHPEQFAKLMEFLGCPNHLWEGGDHAVVQPHFPGLLDYLEKHIAAGKPLPPGIDPNKTYAEYKLVCLKKKGVAE